MILLDTHIWIWYVNNNPKLNAAWRQILENSHPSHLAISVFSCWELAKLSEKRKIDLGLPVLEWIRQAVAFSQVQVIPLDMEIIADSTALPSEFHGDPADQIIVATARIHDMELMSEDSKILSYPYVRTYPKP